MWGDSESASKNTMLESIFKYQKYSNYETPWRVNQCLWRQKGEKNEGKRRRWWLGRGEEKEEKRKVRGGGARLTFDFEGDVP